MDRIKACWLVLLFFASFFTLTANAEDLLSPVGYWQSKNANGTPKNIIQISQTDEHTLVGKIVKTFSKNNDSNFNTGKVILSGFASRSSEGKLMDPDNGRTYSCTLHMAKNGQKLRVLGYVGLPLLGELPLLGHSQTWERVDLMSE